MRPLLVITSLLLCISARGKSPPESHYNKDFDYSRFIGRMTDRSKPGNILKIFSKNTNVKLLHSGDRVYFKYPFGSPHYCKGSVRNTEDPDYVVIYAHDLTPCLRKGEIGIRRGSKLHFLSHKLPERVRSAHQQHKVLLKRREQFLKQLNDINHFIWTYQQQKIKTSAKYKEEMVKIQKEEQRAMNVLEEKKKDGLLLQKEINQRIDKLDENLLFYRIEKAQKIKESWKQDPREMF